MKTIMIAFMLAISLPNALAESAENVSGIMPDSSLYSLDKALDSLSITLTFDRAEKAAAALKVADERLLEVKAMAEKNRLGHALKAQKAPEEAIIQAEKAITQIESDSRAENARNAMLQIAVLQNKTESHYQKVSELKDELLGERAQRMEPQQIAHLNSIFEKIKEKAGEADVKAALKREHAKIKYKALANKTGAEVRMEEKEIDETTGLAKARQERAERGIRKAKEAISKAKEKISKENADLTYIENRLKEVERQVRNADAINEEGKGKDASDIAEEAKDFGNEVSILAEQLGEAKASGNFTAVFSDIEETIAERHKEHMSEVLDKVPEEARKSVQKAIERAEKERISVKKLQNQSDEIEVRT